MKVTQLCPTLCDLIDCIVHEILQARILEWGAIAFSGSIVQLCSILCDFMDCRPPGSSVHGILQTRTLKWVAIPFSRDIPNSGIKPQCPALQAGSLRSDPPGKLSEFPLKKKKKKTNHAPPFPQFSSVAQSCPTLCNPMNSSTPGLPVHHQLPEFTQTHIHRVSDSIQPSHPRSSPSPPASNPSQHQSLFQ